MGNEKTSLSETEKKEALRELYGMNLLQDFLFGECLDGKNGEWFVELMIRRICKRKVKLASVTPQKTVRGVSPDRHGIRMDVLIEDKENCAYDFEPDSYTGKVKLPRRARYYQALIDSKLLDSGIDYDTMKDLVIIFIQPFDAFGEGRMRYTFARRCLELPELPYDDGVRIMFLNTKGNPDEDEELSELLRYIEDSREENARTEDMKKLHSYVEEVKHQHEVGGRYMKTWERERMIREEAERAGATRGKKEGIILGKAEDILLFLKEKGDVSSETEKKICSEQDLKTLERWLLLTAKTKSVEEFEEKM